MTMFHTLESKNKALVMQALDTLFIKRDFAAAAKFWSPHCIHTARTLTQS